MKDIKRRFMNAIENDQGASSLEAIVFISIVIILLGFLFSFWDSIRDYLIAGSKHAGDVDTVTNYDGGASGIVLAK